ncbi:MAG: hypothetical protein RIS59_754 [Pseudomonadota bacterium]|jgi:uncharacterized protein
MLKLLLLIALAVGGLWWFARGRSSTGSGADDRAGTSSGEGAARPGAGRSGETMIRCEYCNTHVPQSAAVLVDKHAFCCEEHRAAAGY